jgi:hypothetical protein
MYRRSYDDRGDDSRCSSGEYVVSIHLTPFIATRWRMQMIMVIIDSFTAIPVLMAHRHALSPFIVADISMVVVVFVPVILGYRDSSDEDRGQNGKSQGLVNTSHEPSCSFDDVV